MFYPILCSGIFHTYSTYTFTPPSSCPSQAKLRCPCCNTRDKETVLTKCFHVFCYECLKTRYDTRQRKCPKCNAAFGANDFHRIYIT